MDCDNHTERGKQVYIYIYHAQCKHKEQESKCLHPLSMAQNIGVGSLKKKKKYRCRKINKGHYTLEMRTNGTRHDILNTNHLREKGRRKEGV